MAAKTKEDYNRDAREKRARRKAAGICTKCGKVPARENLTRCADCEKRKTAWVLAWRKKNPDKFREQARASNKRRRIKLTQDAKERRRKRIKMGLCTSCPNRSRPNRTKCAECAKRDRIRQRNRRNGIPNYTCHYCESSDHTYRTCPLNPDNC